ncbi:MAG: tetratricopeptide repeat protein [Bryobacteraceae bacterium]
MTPEGGSSSSVLGTLALVGVAVVGLSIADAYLARMERQENRAEALRLAAAGRGMVEKGRPLEAVSEFKAALAIERDNPESWLALGQAQLAAGELEGAEETLTELLRRDSTAGAANLALARVLVKEGRVTEAVSIYHRAIYGRWERDAEANRVSARFELVNLLAEQGSKEELLAELLPLLDVAPEDVGVRKHLGRLFLIAGSATRAGEIFREILRNHPEDADAYAGLGESEFARGNYQTARGDFQAAANLRPSDLEISRRLELSNDVLALDPMRRGIGPVEQYERSVRMVELAKSAIRQCSSTLSPLEQDALDEAQKAETKRVPSAQMSKALEENLNLAEQLWKIRLEECKRATTAAEEPLRLVLGKIAQ